MPAYRLSAPYDHPPLKRRLSGLALALTINIGVILILLTLGVISPPKTQKALRGIVVSLIPEKRSTTANTSPKTISHHPKSDRQKPVPKPPPIILPGKSSMTPAPAAKPTPWLEMSKDDMAASDISRIAAAGSGASGDSEVVGKGPNGEALYAAEWAREPTNAELSGYIARTAPEGFGLVACKTIPNDRVEDCVELDQTPGSRLASAVRQAAWQFHVRPPRKGGRTLVGSWVRIRIDYYRSGSGSGD